MSDSPEFMLNPLVGEAESPILPDSEMVQNPSPFCVVLVTCGTEEQAATLSRVLVTERLVACVNRIPGVQSVYEWQGEVCEESEWLLLLKTREALLTPLYQRIKELHAYTVPEFIALPIIAGSKPYLNWVQENTQGAKKPIK